MPELPEVETTRRGLAPHVEGQRITRVLLRRPDLRWPIPPEVSEQLPGQCVSAVRRRAKYLLFDTPAGSAVLHLGMSGVLRVLPANTVVGAHDHVDMGLEDGRVLRFTDPRRFGCLLWQAPGTVHALLAKLGPEPLSEEFSGETLYAASRGKTASIKTFLMDQAVVVGVGNIYAAEALFMAGIRPGAPAGSVSRARYAALADAVKRILGHAIERGGTTLRDFLNPDGLPGYFEQELLVYGREGEACRVCSTVLKGKRLGQRASVWCPSCQK
jgi:formamidopyrimidine-DNA glycosylase